MWNVFTLGHNTGDFSCTSEKRGENTYCFGVQDAAATSHPLRTPLPRTHIRPALGYILRKAGIFCIRFFPLFYELPEHFFV